MKTKILVDFRSNSNAESRKEFWLFAAELILSLAGQNCHVIGHDFTPPPFRNKLERFLCENDIEYLSHSDGVSFEFTTKEQIFKCIQLVNWACSLVVRLENKPLAKAAIPSMKRRLMIKAPHDWYEEHEGDFWALCFFGINPNPAFEIRTSQITLQEILSIYYQTLQSTKLQLRQMEARFVI